jgi:hypothetical protein
VGATSTARGDGRVTGGTLPSYRKGQTLLSFLVPNYPVLPSPAPIRRHIGGHRSELGISAVALWRYRTGTDEPRAGVVKALRDLVSEQLKGTGT